MKRLNIKQCLETLKSAGITSGTYRELSEITGLSESALRNNKDRLNQNGITITLRRRETEEIEEPTPEEPKSTISEQELRGEEWKTICANPITPHSFFLRDRDFIFAKLVINKAMHYCGLPAIFDVEANKQTEITLSCFQSAVMDKQWQMSGTDIKAYLESVVELLDTPKGEIQGDLDTDYVRPSWMIGSIWAPTYKDGHSDKDLKDYLSKHYRLKPATAVRFNRVSQNVVWYARYIVKYLFARMDNIEIPVEDRNLLLQLFVDHSGFNPEEEQVQCVYKIYLFYIEEARLHTATLQSDAGTSKSTVAEIVQLFLEAKGFEQPRIVGPTNRCVAGSTNASTIHRLLDETFRVKSVNIDPNILYYMAKVYPGDQMNPYLIADESSMIDDDTRTILESINDKCLYMGDSRQLAPVNAARPKDFNHIHTLRTQYRFLEAEDDLQVRFSSLYKERRPLAAWELVKHEYADKILGYYKRHVKIAEEGGIKSYTDYSRSLKPFCDILADFKSPEHMIISYAKDAVQAVNELLNGGIDLKVGSKVMLNRNFYDIEQYNGTIYMVEDINKKKLVCRAILKNGDLDSKVYNFRPSDLDLAYAITTQKSQGSEWNHVLAITHTGPVSEQMGDCYVMITRARETIRFIVPNGEVVRNKLNVILNEEATRIIQRMSSAKEGSRNNILYGCVKDLYKLDLGLEELLAAHTAIFQASTSAGLGIEEVMRTVDSASREAKDEEGSEDFTIEKDEEGSYAVPKSLKKMVLGEYPILPSELECGINPSKNSNFYVPIGRSGVPLLSLKTRMAAKLSENEALEFSDANAVAEELMGGVRVVVDCDCREAVDLFMPYLHDTESYINATKDSAHLVFHTKYLIPTRHLPGLDFLGNAKSQLRHIKANKVWNGNLQPKELTQEIWDLVNKWAEDHPKTN